MTAAVIMACSILSFSRMSRISSILFSVIIIIPLHMSNANMCSPIPSYFNLSELSTNFDMVFMT